MPLCFIIPSSETNDEITTVTANSLVVNSWNRVVGIAEIVLGTKQELVALFANKDCIIATILFYENEVNELPVIFNHKVDKNMLDSLKSDIAENIKEFDWESHYDKYQLKLRRLILNKINREIE